MDLELLADRGTGASRRVLRDGSFNVIRDQHSPSSGHPVALEEGQDSGPGLGIPECAYLSGTQAMSPTPTVPVRIARASQIRDPHGTATYRSLSSLRHACDAALLKHRKGRGPLDRWHVTLFHFNRQSVAPHVSSEHPATRDLDLMAPRRQCEERITPPAFVRDSVDLNGHRHKFEQEAQWSMVGPNC
jgi:hypothetical protein